jgi:hypothetical protein
LNYSIAEHLWRDGRFCDELQPCEDSAQSSDDRSEIVGFLMQEILATKRTSSIATKSLEVLGDFSKI